MLVNLIIIALSVSRAAILALFITWFIYGLLNFTLIKTIVFSVIFVGIISLTVFITSKFFHKPEVTIVKHEQYLGQRREKTIEYSWKSALNGGLIGLGYGISDKRFKPELLGYYDKTDEGKIFRREKTISILALIEEVGIIGLILFLAILLYPIKLLFDNFYSDNKKNMPARHFFWRVIPERFNRKSKFLFFTFAFLLSLNIYAQIESWWIGIGSAVLPVYFIFSGMVINFFNKVNYKE